ncbi:MAG: glycoside hydrolase family 88 protein [Pseudomonadota bacterium]
MSATISRIADRTLQWPFRKWAFGEAIALEGLLEAAVVTGQAGYREQVEALCRSTLERAAGTAEDLLAPGAVLLELHSLTGDARWLEAARALVSAHEKLPRTSHGALQVRAHQPGWAWQIWVDSMDLVGPLYARFAAASGESSWLHRAVELMLGYANHLQRPDGLFMHGYDMYAGANGHAWARGQGWALLGMADVLKVCSSLSAMDIEGAAQLRERSLRLVNALVSTQRPSGLWSTVIDAAETYEETTLAAMFVRATNQLEQAGVSLPSRIGTARASAVAAVRRHVDADGSLGLVSSATPVGQLSTYATRPFGVYPWGQGALLLMECSLANAGGS